MPKPLLESFREPPRAKFTNFIEKETQFCHQFVQIIASYYGSQFVFEPFGTFDLLAMQVCNLREICQAHS